MDPSEALEQAMIASFADMAFMDVVEETATDRDVPEGQVAHIDFARPLAGYLTLFLSAPTKQRLVENVYGFGWEALSGSEVDDCLMELLNIVAGNFLRHMGEGEHRHAVSLPQMLYDDSELPGEDDRITRYYRVDDELVRAVLFYRPAEPSR